MIHLRLDINSVGTMQSLITYTRPTRESRSGGGVADQLSVRVSPYPPLGKLTTAGHTPLGRRTTKCHINQGAPPLSPSSSSPYPTQSNNVTEVFEVAIKSLYTEIRLRINRDCWFRFSSRLSFHNSASRKPRNIFTKLWLPGCDTLERFSTAKKLKNRS